MAISSINFKPVKNNSEAHNKRIQKLDYVHSDLSKNNEYWNADEIENRRETIVSSCKKISGRKLQKNATPIREAVINLNSHHTMSDLKTLAATLKKEKGVDCFQIFIHRDEGKNKDDLNYHAHMVFDWQDKKTGKMRRLNKLDMSQIQTLVAHSLNMERGKLKVNSNRERLEPIEYKRQEEAKKLQELQKQCYVLEQKKNRAMLRNTKAERKHKEVKERHNRFEELSKQWAFNGIEKYVSAHRKENKTINKSIELQLPKLKNFMEEEKILSKEYRKLEHEHTDLKEKSDEYTRYENAIFQTQKGIQRLRNQKENEK